ARGRPSLLRHRASSAAIRVRLLRSVPYLRTPWPRLTIGSELLDPRVALVSAGRAGRPRRGLRKTAVIVPDCSAYCFNFLLPSSFFPRESIQESRVRGGSRQMPGPVVPAEGDGLLHGYYIIRRSGRHARNA